tara:strand:+ start:1495 stop:1731 length:237 start_codon:yes stop_codon:yes gene_type:complete
LKTTILHSVGDFLRDVMAAIPLDVVGWLFLSLPLLLLAWVLFAKIAPAEPGTSPRQSRWLRIGAAIALGIQVLVYGLL